MPSLIWSPRSQRDIRRLYDFLAPKSQSAAQRAIKAIGQGVKIIAVHPATGRMIEERPPEYRDCIVPFGSSAYIVRYRFNSNQVVILAIRHGREAGY